MVLLKSEVKSSNIDFEFNFQLIHINVLYKTDSESLTSNFAQIEG